MSLFQTNPEFLRDLLVALKSGRIQLPDFQRGWVWDVERIKGVLASVSRDFPVGAVMMLQSGGAMHFQTRGVEGATFAEGTSADRLILDGQQRLTSLFQATLLNGPANTVNERGKSVERWFYFDMCRCLEAPAKREEAIVIVPPSRKEEPGVGKQTVLDLSRPELEYEQGLFPCSALFDSFAWQQGYGAYWKYASEKMQTFAQFQAEVIQRFITYQVPVITLTSAVPKEAVCHVFEKVNTGGVILTAFELLTATYAVDGFRLRDEWSGPAGADKQGRALLGIQPELRKPAHRVIKSVANTDFLQAIALHHTYARSQTTGESVSCTRATILDLPLAAYLGARQSVLTGFLAAGRFIRELFIYRAEDLPYQTQLAPLAVILAFLGPRWEDLGVKQKLQRWFWCGVFGEIYSGAIETRIARDVPEVLSWIDGGPEPRTIADANFNPTRLLSLRTRNSAAYKGVYALLMKRGGQDWRTGNPITLQVFQDDPTDIHHIFPKHWCGTHKVGPAKMNCIVNKTAISARTNRIVGGRAPSKYLGTLQQKSSISPEQMDVLLSTHAIDPAHLRADDFDGMFQQRAAALLQLIGDAMGKPIDSAPFDRDQSAEDAAAVQEETDEADEDEELEATAA